MVTLKAHILPHHDLQPPGCRGSGWSSENNPWGGGSGSGIHWGGGSGRGNGGGNGNSGGGSGTGGNLSAVAAPVAFGFPA
ncbi:hypothetical protein ACVPLS_005115, partial [Escherichia coli]